jgi:hypothetical protein
VPTSPAKGMPPRGQVRAQLPQEEALLRLQVRVRAQLPQEEALLRLQVRLRAYPD